MTAIGPLVMFLSLLVACAWAGDMDPEQVDRLIAEEEARQEEHERADREKELADEYGWADAPAAA